ncbi:hypothetical protein AB0J47_41825 [Nocardia sp. NPDC049737]|uniref:hypothetical protein n=1 Tax=Nocardia sp. NPDC049737 TaxID=3154358 RepID=UPI00341ECA83
MTSTSDVLAERNREQATELQQELAAMRAERDARQAETDSIPLSKHFADPLFRWTPDRPRPTWAKVDPKPGAWCDECSWLQHESGGGAHRLQPRKRRSFPRVKGAPSLRLCARHAQAWEHRDQQDEKERINAGRGIR